MSGSLDDWGNLHGILRELYDRMLYLCDDLTGVATGIAGLGALLYVSYRVWQALARAEPVDLFPLLRPFCIGLAILLFQPVVLNTLNGVLSPLVVGVHQMLEKRCSTCRIIRKKRIGWNGKNRYIIRHTAFCCRMSSTTGNCNRCSYRRRPTGFGFHVRSQQYVQSETLVAVLCPVAAGIAFRCGEFGYRRTADVSFDRIVGSRAAQFRVLGLRRFSGNVGAVVRPIHNRLPMVAGGRSFQLYDCCSQTLSLEREIEMIGSGNWIPDASNTTYILFMIVALFGYFCVPSIALVDRSGQWIGRVQS